MQVDERMQLAGAPRRFFRRSGRVRRPAAGWIGIRLRGSGGRAVGRRERRGDADGCFDFGLGTVRMMEWGAQTLLLLLGLFFLV
ncbi:hypothetical protein OMP38_03265 [Cohnella ginsengisoli]|uniref:Uncharacterized protein n=1 Tax=Cohnella ginsengisoli TaxID=425004 RepID=A0A9X4KDF6_9BACL|nr:hypothetical protein [Cohnella ginsengisoli]MDG0789983.1 hypothetical protein [Cohnella ginsengisoli]